MSRSRRRRRRAGSGRVPLIAILILVSGGVALYHYFPRHELDAALEPVAATQPGVSEAATLEPVPAPAPAEDVAPEPAEPLPALAESDPVVRAALEGLVGTEIVARFLVPDDIVSRFVATIDNLPNPKVALKLRPIQPFEGPALARRDSAAASRLVLGEEHFTRYAPLVGMVQATSADRLAAVYRRFRPLLQEAYEDLGYPGESFDARLIQVIDHLLQTPEVSAPIAVVRPKFYFEFADRSLEERSAGQKLLIRMGPRNAAIVKQRLRELRARLGAGGAIPR